MARRKHRKRKTLAANADRHHLYQESVQCVEAEIDMVDQTYKELRGRHAVRLREDFCGTGNTSCEWVRRRRANTAVGFDLDPEVLAWRTIQEKTKLDGFTYYWEQRKFNPITFEALCHIHFKFPDGSKMKRAFTYDWRMWTLPEIRETLADAGFAKSTVYWEGTDEKTGEGNDIYTPTEEGEDDPSWIVYIVAEK